ncbi:MAG: hypothetical protein H7256_04185, partial [Bdellovibrio sp.]|nr:hypothetical protein [Bdellovibrio sp.]
FYFGDTSRLLTFNPGSQTYGSVSWYGSCASGFALTGTLNMAGTLSFTGGCPASINGGTINATGNISYTGNGSGGTVKVIANGSTNQTISGSAGGSYAPSLEIASTGGAVTVSSGINFLAGLKYTSGTVDLSASRIAFNELGYQNTVIPGNLLFNDVTWYSDCQGKLAVTGTMQINGTTTMSGGCPVGLPSGKLRMYGNANFLRADPNSGVQLEFAGSTATTVASTINGMPGGNVEVTKTGGGKITLTTKVAFSGVSQIFTLTSGSVDMAGFNLSMPSLTLNGNTVTRNGGALSVNGSTVAAGSQSVYGGTVAP